MALAPYTVKVLECCQVSPPPGSVPPSTSLPLTFFDIPLLLCCPVQRLFFYEFPHPTLHFTNTILPILKHSLSLTLQHFFPLAGNMTCPPPPTKPEIVYAVGDSVPLTIAESTADFIHLSSNYPRDVRESHPLVPQLSSTCVSDDTQLLLLPLLGLQVTVFPNSGICIGITSRHVVADGRSIIHFVKSWASVCRFGGELTSIDHKYSIPLCSKAVIKDPHGLETIFFNDWWEWGSSWTWRDDCDTTATDTVLANKVRATFVMGRTEIDRLKQLVLTQIQSDRDEPKSFHVSTFVVTCAFMWVCLSKAQRSTGASNLLDDYNKLHHFFFLADCRNRLEFRVPETYFGNCLLPGFVSVKRSELVGENGFVAAAKAIGSEVGRLLDSGLMLRGAEKWMSNLKEARESGQPLTVAGSPKLGVYETDFGWGRPKKSELVHIDVSGSIALTESRDEEGAVEVGLALTGAEMNAFISLFQQGPKVL